MVLARMLLASVSLLRMWLIRKSLFRNLRSCIARLWMERPLIGLDFDCAGSAGVNGLWELVPRSIKACVRNRFGSRIPVVRIRIHNWSNSPVGLGEAVGVLGDAVRVLRDAVRVLAASDSC